MTAAELSTCLCCFDDEIRCEDVVKCPIGHEFCATCVRKGVEIKIGEAQTTYFPCLTECNYEISYNTLQQVLDPNVFERLAQRQQMEEVMAVEMDDFVVCPFCEFGLVLAENVTVFTCLNPGCMKISCRLCKELNHLPLKCDEVEHSNEVKARTFIENRMTQALIRTCNNCKKEFVKEDGCNMMTCVCGAHMCYLCRETVQNYRHFNGQGGGEIEKCPLYSNNDQLHVDAVNAAADGAKREMEALNPGLELRHDPTAVRVEPRHRVGGIAAADHAAHNFHRFIVNGVEINNGDLFENGNVFVFNGDWQQDQHMRALAEQRREHAQQMRAQAAQIRGAHAQQVRAHAQQRREQAEQMREHAQQMREHAEQMRAQAAQMRGAHAQQVRAHAEQMREHAQLMREHAQQRRERR